MENALEEINAYQTNVDCMRPTTSAGPPAPKLATIMINLVVVLSNALLAASVTKDLLEILMQIVLERENVPLMTDAGSTKPTKSVAPHALTHAIIITISIAPARMSASPDASATWAS